MRILKKKRKLGWKDSNLRMVVPKTTALPLGDTPIMERHHMLLYETIFRQDQTLIFPKIFKLPQAKPSQYDLLLLATTLPNERLWKKRSFENPHPSKGVQRFEPPYHR